MIDLSNPQEAKSYLQQFSDTCITIHMYKDTDVTFFLDKEDKMMGFFLQNKDAPKTTHVYIRDWETGKEFAYEVTP